MSTDILATETGVQQPDEYPPIRKASELASLVLPMPAELVKGVLSVGSTMVYGGGSKTNKTFALMDLAVSVATGEKWWDMETVQGDVIYIDFELQEPYFKSRLERIAESKGTSLSKLDRLHTWNLRGKADDIEKLMPILVERVKEIKPKLIILDPVYKVLGNRDENKAGDINSLMNMIDKIATHTGSALILGHHFSKGNQASKSSMDRISGSGVFGRSPDAIVVITKHEEDNVFTVEMTLRNFQMVDPFCVEWDYPLMVPRHDLDPSKLNKPGGTPKKASKEQVLLCLGKHTLTTKEWQERTIDIYPMSERTFATRKNSLKKLRKIEEVDGKWRIKVELDAKEKSIVDMIDSDYPIEGYVKTKTTKARTKKTKTKKAKTTQAKTKTTTGVTKPEGTVEITATATATAHTAAD